MKALAAKSALAESWYELSALVFAAALFALLVGPNVELHSLGEPDLARMLFGLVYGEVTGQRLGAGFQYGANFSFGYYLGFFHLIPSRVLADPYRLAVWMNLTGFVSALLAIPLVWSFVRRVSASSNSAAAATIVFFFSPLVLVLATSGHPVLPAFVLAIGAGVAFVAATSADRPRWAMVLIGTLLAFASLCIRADMALAFPMLIWASQREAGKEWQWRREIRPMLIRLAALALAVLAFLVVQTWVMAGRHLDAAAVAAPKGFGSLIRFIAMFYDVARIPKGFALMVLGCGLAVIFACLLFVLAYRKARLDAFRSGLLLLTVLPSLLFWLPNPQPVRHFLLVAFGCAMLIGWFADAFAKSVRLTIVAAVCLALANQLFAEALFPRIVSHYEWSYTSPTERRTTDQVPLGAFWKDGPAKVALNEVFRAEAQAVVRAAEKAPLLIVFGDEIYYLASYFCAADKDLRARAVDLSGIPMLFLESDRHTVVLVEKQPVWPKDVAQEVLADKQFASWPYYVQAATLSRYDVGLLPDRRLEIAP